MKRKVSSRKNLKIVKQTLRNLSESDLHSVHGGLVQGLCTLMRSACSSYENHDTTCHQK